MTLRGKLFTAGLLLLAVPAANAKKKDQQQQGGFKLTAEQVSLIDHAAAREKETTKAIQQRAPVIETYLQTLKFDPQLQQVPISDDYLVGRVDLGKVIDNKLYSSSAGPSRGIFKGSLNFVSSLTKSFKFEFAPAGFVGMLLLDPTSFDRQRYDFHFVRREFLGEVRTSVFDVMPKKNQARGRFFGRIWVEDQDAHVVRFNGSFTSSSSDRGGYFHFDSWRSNVQPGIWLPNSVYVEESQGTVAKHPQAFKGQSRIWGYSLKIPTSTGENESVQIDAVTDQSASAQDVSPLEARREWTQLAENNILDRLFQAGLLAGPSDFDKVLETVANNIIITNNLPIDNVRCRVLLTTPLESVAIGNTIILSKGLVDTLPYEEDLAAVISFQLAHIANGDRLDTKFAFSDRLLFPDASSFQRIPMHHSDTQNAAAAKKAGELLAKSPYNTPEKQANIAMYFEMLQLRAKALEKLNEPRLGDGLVSNEKTDQLWLQSLAKGPKIDMNNLTQIVALPLNSHLKVDPWDDRVLQLNVKPVAPLNASDKMPFEIAPVFLKLTRNTGATATAAAPPTSAANQNNAAVPANGAAATANQNGVAAGNGAAAPVTDNSGTGMGAATDNQNTGGAANAPAAPAAGQSNPPADNTAPPAKPQ